MRIDVGLQNIYGSAQSSATSKAESRPRFASGSDSLRSNDAASVSLSDPSSIRQQRIEALTLQVQSGTYKVDAKAVAASMFDAQFGR